MKKKIIGILTALTVSVMPLTAFAENIGDVTDNTEAAAETTYTWDLTATDRTVDATDTAVYALVNTDGMVTDSDSSGWKSPAAGEIGIFVAGNGKNTLSTDGLYNSGKNTFIYIKPVEAGVVTISVSTIAGTLQVLESNSVKLLNVTETGDYDIEVKANTAYNFRSTSSSGSATVTGLSFTAGATLPTAEPTEEPTPEPTETPTELPEQTVEPEEPTEYPTEEPTEEPTAEPTTVPDNTVVLKADKNSVKYDSPVNLRAYVVKDGETTELDAESVSFKVYNEAKTRLVTNDGITLDGGTLAVDKSVLPQYINLAAVYDGAESDSVKINVLPSYATASEGTGDIFVTADACEEETGVYPVCDGAADGSGYYLVSEDYEREPKYEWDLTAVSQDMPAGTDAQYALLSVTGELTTADSTSWKSPTDGYIGIAAAANNNGSLTSAGLYNKGKNTNVYFTCTEAGTLTIEVEVSGTFQILKNNSNADSFEITESGTYNVSVVKGAFYNFRNTTGSSYSTIKRIAFTDGAVSGEPYVFDGFSADTTADAIYSADVKFLTDGAGIALYSADETVSGLDIAYDAASGKITAGGTECCAADSDTWYNISIICSAGSDVPYARLIVYRYADGELVNPETGETGVPEVYEIADMGEFAECGAAKIAAKLGTAVDNAVVLKAVPDSITAGADSDTVTAGGSVTLGIVSASRQGYVLTAAGVSPTWSICTADGGAVDEDYPAGIDGDELSVDAVSDITEIYVKAAVSGGSVCDIVRLNVNHTHILNVIGIGISEDGTRLLEIDVDKLYEYDGKITLLACVYDSQGTLKSTGAKTMMCSSLNLGTNTVKCSLNLGEYDKTADTLKVFAWSNLN